VNGGAWTVLGAGCALPRRGYGPSGHVLELPELEGLTLFDCGPGSLRSLPAWGFDWRNVRRIVLSHFHIDHCLDLAAFAFAQGNPGAEAGPLEVFATPGIDRVLEGLEFAFGTGARFRETRVHELPAAGGATGLDLGGVRLHWTANGHKDQSVSLRVQLPDGRAVAYTGDTGPVDALTDLARGVDLLVSECSFPSEAPAERHLTPRRAGELATAAGVGRLLLTHFYPMLDPGDAALEAAQHFAGPIETARDGSRHLLTPLRSTPQTTPQAPSRAT